MTLITGKERTIETIENKERSTDPFVLKCRDSKMMDSEENYHRSSLGDRRPPISFNEIFLFVAMNVRISIVCMNKNKSRAYYSAVFLYAVNGFESIVIRMYIVYVYRVPAGGKCFCFVLLMSSTFPGYKGQNVLNELTLYSL